MSLHHLKLINMRLHFALSRMTIGSYYTCMIHTFTGLTLISLILPNSQNAVYKVCTYTTIPIRNDGQIINTLYDLQKSTKK